MRNHVVAAGLSVAAACVVVGAALIAPAAGWIVAGVSIAALVILLGIDIPTTTGEDE